MVQAHEEMGRKKRKAPEKGQNSPERTPKKLLQDKNGNSVVATRSGRHRSDKIRSQTEEAELSVDKQVQSDQKISSNTPVRKNRGKTAESQEAHVNDGNEAELDLPAHTS